MANLGVDQPAATLVELFRRGRPADADAPLLLMPDGSVISYAEADQRSGQLARLLEAEGVEVGDRVGVQIEKSPTAIWSYLACLRTGAVLLPMNPAYTPEEVAYLLEDAAPRLVIADPRAPAARLAKTLYTCDTSERGSLAEALAPLPTDFEDRAVGPNAPAILPYTSGTTGRPKGAVLTQRNLAANTESLLDTWGFTPDDVLIHILPLFHVHGLVVALNCVLASGSRIRFFDRFDAPATIEAFSSSSVLMGVPTHYHRLLQEPALTPEACAPMRVFISGSAPLLPQVFEEFCRRSGKPILERYGMTETAMLTSNPLEGERRAGTVGRPLPGVSVRIADPSTGEPLPPGGIGEVQVAGENVFAGYFGRPELTATEFCSDGYFRTGDLGTFSDDGYLSIVGRSKDLVISGGFNVYPREVEDVLDELPGVAESAVIGLPDPDFGEAVVAVVVALPGASVDPQATRDAAREHLAPYKVPKQVVVVGELPRNTMGKVDKASLRRDVPALLPARTGP